MVEITLKCKVSDKNYNLAKLAIQMLGEASETLDSTFKNTNYDTVLRGVKGKELDGYKYKNYTLAPDFLFEKEKQ